MSASDFALSFDFKEDLKRYVINRLIAGKNLGLDISDIIECNTSRPN